MDNDKPQIKQLIDDAPIGNVTSIDLIGNGYASVAYKIISSNGEFIALAQKEDGIEPADYAYHFAILKALETIKYKFAPRAIYVDPRQTVIVMTPVPGEPIGWINTASEGQQKRVVNLLIEALLDLRSVSFTECAASYKALTGKDLKAKTIQDNVKHYMTDWFRLAQNGQPDPVLTKWVEPKVELCEEFAKHTEPSNRRVFVHGDTSEVNILLTRDLQLGLIDWDTSEFNQYPEGWDDFGVAYLMNHVPLFQKFRSLAISLLSERTHITVGELEKIILRQQENIKLGDIMWAYMMNARAAAGKIKDNPSKFMKIAQQRISDYESMFAKNSFLA
jgi:aminoglycoside phosphotransferase (APT) family kinase protein